MALNTTLTALGMLARASCPRNASTHTSYHRLHSAVNAADAGDVVAGEIAAEIADNVLTVVADHRGVLLRPQICRLFRTC